jgi:hypothetical protein
MQANQNVILLKGFLKEGYKPATSWLHVSAALAAFTGDILEPRFEHCPRWFGIGGLLVAAVALLLATQFPKALKKLAALFTASLIVATLSGALLLLERY